MDVGAAVLYLMEQTFGERGCKDKKVQRQILCLQSFTSNFRHSEVLG